MKNLKKMSALMTVVIAVSCAVMMTSCSKTDLSSIVPSSDVSLKHGADDSTGDASEIGDDDGTGVEPGDDDGTGVEPGDDNGTDSTGTTIGDDSGHSEPGGHGGHGGDDSTGHH